MKLKNIIMILLAATTLFATKENKNAAEWSITPFAQTALSLYSDNWDTGELGSITWIAKIDATFKKQLSNFLLTENFLNLTFGQTFTQEEKMNNEKEFGKPIKSNDNIEFKSNLDFTLKSPVDPFIGVHLTSQFWDNKEILNKYDVPVKLNLKGNPVTITETIGISHKTDEKESVELNSRLGMAFRQDIDRTRELDNDLENENLVNDIGLQFETHLKATTKDNRLTFASDFYFFKAFARPGEDDFSSNSDAKVPDLKWDNNLKVKIIKIISIDILIQMLYDKEIDSGTRWKENMALSLSYTFTNKK